MKQLSLIMCSHVCWFARLSAVAMSVAPLEAYFFDAKHFYLSCRASPMHKENLRILDLTKYFEAVGQSPTQNDKCFYQTHSALRIWSYFFQGTVGHYTASMLSQLDLSHNTRMPLQLLRAAHPVSSHITALLKWLIISEPRCVILDWRRSSPLLSVQVSN